MIGCFYILSYDVPIIGEDYTLHSRKIENNEVAKTSGTMHEL